jgi:general L-amino acid transport system ATP-binding protein
MEPTYMMFDELTRALDPEMIKEVLDVIIDLAKGGMTMLCVTHEMGFAKEVADEIIFMDEGKIVERGTYDDFFNNPQTDRAKLFLSQIFVK